MFELLQSFDVGCVQHTVFGLPFVVRGRTDAVLPPDLIDGASCIGLFENGHTLRLVELKLAHGNLLARVAIVPESSPYDCLDLRGAYAPQYMIESCELSRHDRRQKLPLR